MHRWENHAECLLLWLWLQYNGKQRISLRARWLSIFCAINYPGSWANGTLTACFFSHITKRIGDYKICMDQGFPQLVFLSGQYLRGAPIDCIALFMIIWFVLVTFILLFGRQVNGEWEDYRGYSLTVKNTCQQTRTRGRRCWSVLFVYTIFKLSLLGLIRSQRYSTPNTKMWLMFTDTIGSEDII